MSYFSFQHYVSCYIIVYIAFKLLICACMYENWDGTLGKLTVLVIQNLKLYLLKMKKKNIGLN